MKKLKNRNKLNASSPFHKSNLAKVLNKKTPFAIREAYSTCRARLMFTQRGEKHPIFVVTSPSPGDGKTISTINTAISFANAGKKTLVIDMDLRNASVHRYFSDTVSGSGLSEYLAGIKKDALPQPTHVNNLFVLPVGYMPPNPSELLTSDRVGIILDQLRKEFDYIFIDTPPVNMVSDAALLSEFCTGYIIVARIGKTRTSELRRALSALSLVSGRVSGILINDASGEGRRYMSYYDYKKSRNYYYHGYYGHNKTIEDNKEATAAKQLEGETV